MQASKRSAAGLHPLRLGLASRKIEFELPNSIVVLLCESDEVNSDLPCLWRKHAGCHLTFAEVLTNQSARECRAIGNALDDVVDRLLHASLPLELAVDRDDIQLARSRRGLNVDTISGDIECMGMWPSRSGRHLALWGRQRNREYARY